MIQKTYFEEDVWPSVSELFEKLCFDEDQLYKLFEVFCFIDEDENKSIDVMKCYDYIGGPQRTKFTERIYDVDSKDNKLDFNTFALMTWNYCTLSVASLARMVFEIFDIDFKQSVTKLEVETMFRMLYDCDESDPKIIQKFPFESDDTITKAKFVEYVNKNRSLIKPAIKYQSHLRKFLGGELMWAQLSSSRKTHFQVYEIEV